MFHEENSSLIANITSNNINTESTGISENHYMGNNIIKLVAWIKIEDTKVQCREPGQFQVHIVEQTMNYCFQIKRLFKKLREQFNSNIWSRGHTGSVYREQMQYIHLCDKEYEKPWEGIYSVKMNWKNHHPSKISQRKRTKCLPQYIRLNLDCQHKQGRNRKDTSFRISTNRQIFLKKKKNEKCF